MRVRDRRAVRAARGRELCYHHAREQRSEEQVQLTQPDHQAVRRRQQARLEHAREDGRAGRIYEGGRDADPEGDGVDHPKLDGTGGDERAQQTDQDGVDTARDEQHVARVEAVDDRAADENERRLRQRNGREHGAERERIAGELEDEPGHRDDRELVAEHRDGAARHQQPEAAVGEERLARRRRFRRNCVHGGDPVLLRAAQMLRQRAVLVHAGAPHVRDMIEEQPRSLIAVLAMFAAAVPFELDMYLPGLPAIASDLGTGAGDAARRVKAFLFGLALDQLLMGPLSNKYQPPRHARGEPFDLHGG